MRRIVFFLSISLILCLGAGAAFSDHGHNGRQRNRYQQGQGLGKHQVPTVNNPLYREQCGQCHMAYQPALLPVASWKAILAKLPGHFGEEVELAPQDRAALEVYLAANAAESSGCRMAGKILASLGGQIPLRVSQTPYILRKHDGHHLPAGVFQRPAVGSRGNCRACHLTAEQGCYDDKLVRIPR